MTLNPEKVTRLDIDNDKIKFDGENPEEIIGLSQAFIKQGKDKPRILYIAQRKTIGSNIRSDLKDVIKNLKHPELLLNKLASQKKIYVDGFSVLNVTFEDKVLSHESFYALKNALKNNYGEKNSLFPPTHSQRPKEFIWVDKNESVNYGFKRPFLHIKRPTLLVFTTSVPAAWTQRIMKRQFISPKDGYTLDPTCSDLRLWMDDQVLGLYSNGQYGNLSAENVTEYWYDLVYGFEHKNKRGIVNTFMSPNNTFDPGNGTGVGEPFP